MNKYWKIIIISCLIWVSSFTTLSTAQEESSQRLSIDNAVRLAVKHNPDLESARLDVKRSDARVLEAWGYAMPSVDVSGQYTHFIDKPVTFFPDVFLYGFMKAIDSTIPKPTGKLVPVSLSALRLLSNNYFLTELLLSELALRMFTHSSQAIFTIQNKLR
jgi:hypothetical protein